jgi:hypothetical protein
MSEIFNGNVAEIRGLFPDPLCVTWVRNAGLDVVLRAFGGDSADTAAMTWGEVQTAAYDGDDGQDKDDHDSTNSAAIALAESSGDHVVVIEPASRLGAHGELLRELSVQGPDVLSLSWTVNHDVRVIFAAGGKIVVSFDPHELFAATGDDPAAAHAWFTDLPISVEHWQEDWMTAAFSLGAHLTGIRVDRSWLTQPHLKAVFRLSPRRSADRPALRLNTESQELLQHDARIAAIAAEPADDKLPQIIQILAEQVVRTTGIEGELVDEALHLINVSDRGERAQALRERLRSFGRRLEDQARTVFQEANAAGFHPGRDTVYGRLLLQQGAVDTLWEALDPDLSWAARQTIVAAHSTHPENDDWLRVHTLSVIDYYIRYGDNVP